MGATAAAELSPEKFINTSVLETEGIRDYKQMKYWKSKTQDNTCT